MEQHFRDRRSYLDDTGVCGVIPAAAAGPTRFKWNASRPRAPSCIRQRASTPREWRVSFIRSTRRVCAEQHHCQPVGRETLIAGRYAPMAAVFEHARFRCGRVAHAQRGAFLLEALVALLIFSFGVMAMAGLQTRAARHFNEAQYRANAAELAQATIASMRASDPATLAARFDPSAGTADWLELLGRAKRLP